jgi:hypothetical protein
MTEPLLGKQGTSSEYSYVLKVSTSISNGGFDSNYLKPVLQLVNYNSCERLCFEVLSKKYKRFLGLLRKLKERNDLLYGRNDLIDHHYVNTSLVFDLILSSLVGGKVW